MPEKRVKTTMSVREMREMLGLGKTESYWLVHKNYFETILVYGKMRIVVESFEKWYANQVKYKKVNGSAPGAELRQMSYSPQEIAKMLDITDSSVYYLIKRDHRILRSGMSSRKNTARKRTVLPTEFVKRVLFPCRKLPGNLVFPVMKFIRSSKQRRTVGNLNILRSAISGV